MTRKETIAKLEELSREVERALILSRHGIQDDEETGYVNQHGEYSTVTKERLRRAAAGARVLSKRLTNIESEDT